MCTAIKDLTKKYPEVDFVYPMHLNPNVRKPIHDVFGEELSDFGNMFFIEPLEYLSFVYLMEKSTIVLTDIDDKVAYEKMSKAVNPYGDGLACGRIVNALLYRI